MLQRYGLLLLRASRKTCFLTYVFEHSAFFSTFFVKNDLKHQEFLVEVGASPCESSLCQTRIFRINSNLPNPLIGRVRPSFVVTMYPKA